MANRPGARGPLSPGLPLSPMLNLEDIEWKNLVMHWSHSQDEVLSMKPHDNLNFYVSTCALRIFFAGNLLEKEFKV